MTFARLTRGDWVAGIAALALLLLLSATWYSTDAGVEARKIEQNTEPRGAAAGEVPRAVDRTATTAADQAEQTAWEPDAFADRLVLFALLAASILAVAAAWLRAADVRLKAPFSASALATGVGLTAALLLAARILQKPSVEPGAVIKAGAPLGLLCVGILTLGARAAWNAERDGTVTSAEPDGDSGPGGEPDTPESAATARPAPLFDPVEADASPAPAATATVARPEPEWAPEWSDGAPEPPPEPADRSSRRKRRDAKKSRRRRS